MLNVVKHPAEFGGILLPQGSIRMIREKVLFTFVTLSGKILLTFIRMNFKELYYGKFTIICLRIVWKTLDIRPK